MSRYDSIPAEVQALIRSLLHPLARAQLAKVSRIEQAVWGVDRAAALQRWEPPPVPHPLESELRALLGPDRRW